MFELNRQKAKLSAFNCRAELHGDDTKPASDLKLEMKVSNDVLSFFDPSLKSSLYKANESAQGELINEPGHLPSLKFPHMAPVKWGKEFAGYEVTVHYGVSGDDDVTLTGCEIDGFVFDCQDGGTVGVKFRVICHPDDHGVSTLYKLIQREVDITLTPPSADQQLQKDLEEAAA